MEALKFARELKMMCEFYNACVDCPAKGPCGVTTTLEDSIPIVEKWSKEHREEKENGSIKTC